VNAVSDSYYTTNTPPLFVCIPQNIYVFTNMVSTINPSRIYWAQAEEVGSIHVSFALDYIFDSVFHVSLNSRNTKLKNSRDRWGLLHTQIALHVNFKAMYFICNRCLNYGWTKKLRFRVHYFTSLHVCILLTKQWWFSELYTEINVLIFETNNFCVICFKWRLMHFQPPLGHRYMGSYKPS